MIAVGTKLKIEKGCTAIQPKGVSMRVLEIGAEVDQFVPIKVKILNGFDSGRIKQLWLRWAKRLDANEARLTQGNPQQFIDVRVVQ